MQYKKKPNVIFMKGPRDKLLKMTEQTDQTFSKMPHDPTGVYGGRIESHNSGTGYNSECNTPIKMSQAQSPMA